MQARRIAGIPADLKPDAAEAARACAKALGAVAVDPALMAGKVYTPDLYVAFGVGGSTEHNAAVRGARIIVAVIEDQSAPIAQIADYLLIGDVADQTKALLNAL